MNILDAMKSTSITNAFHHHDLHNQKFTEVLSLLDPSSFVVVTASGYYTGNRDVIQLLVDHIKSTGDVACEQISATPKHFSLAWCLFGTKASMSVGY